jgi:hypothetical protein
MKFSFKKNTKKIHYVPNPKTKDSGQEAHRVVRAVKLPNDAGSGPVKELYDRSLQPKHPIDGCFQCFYRYNSKRFGMSNCLLPKSH